MTDEELIELGRVGRPPHPGAHLSAYLLWFGRKVIAAQQEQWEELAVGFQHLDDLGFISSYGEEGDAACSHWLSIAREGLTMVRG